MPDRRNIFHRMNREIDSTIQQGIFKFACEQAFAAKIFELTFDLVARRFQDFNLPIRRRITGFEQVFHPVRLIERQRTAARADMSGLLQLMQAFPR